MASRSIRGFDDPRNYLFVRAQDQLGAAAAVETWVDGPPDLCVISPSRAARATAAFACSGRHVPVVDEPLLAGRYPFETVDDFDARYAEALLVVYALDTRAALVVCDDVPSGWTTPCVLGDKGLLRVADLIERELPPQ